MTQRVLARSGVRLLALFALLAGLLIAPAAVAAPLSTTVTGGELSWGVKNSWNSYVAGAGEINANAGASQQGSDYVFGSGTGTIDSDGRIDANFSGAVHFTAHGGELDLTLANPRLELTGSTGTLFVDVTKKGAKSPQVALATLDAPERQISSNQVIVTGAEASLTEAGAAAFDNYPAGAALDPVSATISIAEGSLEPFTDDDPEGEVGDDSEGEAGSSDSGDEIGAEPPVVTEPPAKGQASVSVSRTVFGVDESATVTVKGSGFDPSMAKGSRPPLAGKAAGAYVVFGAFADEWQPSKGAKAPSRPVTAGQKWALPVASHATVGGDDAGAIALEADGSFTAELPVSKALIDAAQKDPSLATNIGIYTYAGSGATLVEYETFTPITFAAPSVTVSQHEFPAGESGTVTVKGQNFLPGMATGTRPPAMGRPAGAYVVFGAFADEWQPSTGAKAPSRPVNAGQKWALPADQHAAVGGAGAGAVALEVDGSFTAELPVSKALLEDVQEGASSAKNIGIYTYAGSGANVAPYETFTPLTFVDSPPVGQASVSVSKTKFDAGESTTITVTGQGFDPSLATGTRPPFMGRPGGAYVVFGAFADEWKPSKVADPATRAVNAGQKWALPADQHSVLGDPPPPSAIALEADGSFTAELEVSKALIDETQKTKGDPAAAAKNIGVYTYAGSGATTAAYETYTPLTFAGKPPVVDEPPVVEVPAPAVRGSLHWGVKTSWRNYVKANGTALVSGGAGDSTSTYDFGQKSTTAKPPSAPGATTYRGAVRFNAHAGQLDVTLRDPVVKITSKKKNEAVLSAIVAGKRVNIVSADLGKARRTAGDGSVRYAGAPTKLMKSAVGVFSDYSAGTAFDPLTFTIGANADANAAPPAGPGAGGTPGKQATSGKSKPSAKPVRSTTDRSVPGSLSWGVKGSWRTYLNGRAKAKVTVRGAKSTGSAWVFGQSSTTAEPPSPVGTTSYRGSVNFLAHGGALNLTLSEPSVRVAGGSKAILSFQGGGGRVDVAALNLAASSTKVGKGSITYSGAPATLLPNGVSVFKNFYQAGEVLDPVTFTIGSTAQANNVSFVSASTAATEWKAPATPPATTGLKVSKAKVKVGDTITASGAGFQPNEGDIRVVLYSSPRVLEMKVTADASGRATWSGAMPDVETGKHTLTFQGSTNLGAPITVEAAKKLKGCKVSDASLQWGFKEAFRSYVSGTIADGDWSTSEGASYETPEFLWSKGEGVMNSEAGSIDFDGTVEFSGHQGALDTTILNPTIAFNGENSATLLLDYSSSAREDAMVGKGKKETVEAVPFVDLDLSKGKRTVEGDLVTITDVPAVFTSQGNAVFSTYQAGDSFDPVSIAYTIKSSCDPSEAGDDSVAAAGAAESTSGSGNSGTPPWVWLLLAAAIVVGAAAGAGGTLFAVRRRAGG